MSTRYLSVADVIEYHRRLLEQQGRPQAPVIDAGKLEAAVARPQTEVFGEELFATLPEKAAALLQSLVIGHPFLNGKQARRARSDAAIPGAQRRRYGAAAG
ncbi:MAG: type II toxin-antitoxin system death-on-curing family toxin [Tepidiformaceae bacterium]